MFRYHLNPLFIYAVDNFVWSFVIANYKLSLYSLGKEDLLFCLS
jgi:hypothetical protein